MRTPITKDEVDILITDLDMLGDQQLVGIEAYEAMRLLEMRRQTSLLEAIKQLLERKEKVKAE
ncbi:hypothetical protein AT000_04775 [Salmonella enterica]|uniref:Uncharacterized protein n=4 Tax=Enterobacteriaceae TaxID=543 RepID=A0A637DI69_SALET|nr:hypothetical protein [Salmonella enterica subsp. enterica serovar Neukoelln]EAA7092005.1 hypothetical protein [Salmonella enterica subsp. enterica serovar Koketime]EAB4621351.1 hypothetical protein [Salmonella enterica]EAB8207036.1 hypothetical protein [Salmonella enterica subsp. enterica serovar Lattenkamp]EAB9458854.1 hypothetical protein [Salmonella enterica subsp. enterica serovar Poona]EBU9022917.1 hypothetical protein [Salmonella enterica subsp. enterica serovar Ullevi]EBV4492914.1 h